jgi:hypothetical protein
MRLKPAWIDAWLERHAPEASESRAATGAQSGAAS